MNELVSVIIPNYNKEQYLKKCIDSVLEQSYHPIEIIIVDDCSTDMSRLILQDYKKNNNNLNVVEFDHNQGVSNARNAGVSKANGQFITFLDSDDYYANNYKIEKEMNLQNYNNNKPTLSYSKILYVDKNGDRLDEMIQEESKYHSRDILWDLIIDNNPLCMPRDYIIKKEQFMEVGGYISDLSLYEDLDLLLRLLEKCDAQCTYDFGTAYRLNTGGLSQKSEKVCMRSKWGILWKNSNILKNKKNVAKLLLIYKRVLWECKFILKSLIQAGGA